MRSATEILKSLVVDIDEMRAGGKSSFLFGPFGSAYQRDDGMTIIEWPNIAILAREARQLLEGNH